MVCAIVVLKGVGIEGTIRFEQEREGGVVTINGSVTGLKGGSHGFHIHEFGDTSNGCISAGAHYNPFKREHGDPNSQERHVGDLGNIEACYQTGTAIVSKRDSMISLFGDYSIIGRTLIVHADRDDLGKGGQPDSKTTGHAGARIACGIVARQ